MLGQKDSTFAVPTLVMPIGTELKLSHLMTVFVRSESAAGRQLDFKAFVPNVKRTSYGRYGRLVLAATVPYGQ